MYKLGFKNVPAWTYYCRHNYDGKFSVPSALQILNFEFYTSYYYIALAEVILLVFAGSTYLILALRRLLKK